LSLSVPGNKIRVEPLYIQIGSKDCVMLFPSRLDFYRVVGSPRPAPGLDTDDSRSIFRVRVGDGEVPRVSSVIEPSLTKSAPFTSIS
jgi:hypothetical protein